MLRRLYRAVRTSLRAFLPPRKRCDDIRASTQASLEAMERKLHQSLEDVQQNLQRTLTDRFTYTDNLIRDEATRLSDQLNLVLRDLSRLTDRQLEYQRETRLLLGQMSLPPTEFWLDRLKPGGAPGQGVFNESVLCRQDSFEQAYFAYWVGKLGYGLHYHRKLWEFVFICQTLFERGLLRSGARGLGFGVGEEPLSAYFASQGCRITGTDMASEAAQQSGWVDTAQHAAGKEALRISALCPDPVFDANVEFRFCDMNQIPADLVDYDFCWSACALEHLGSIDQGLAFIERSLDCLKPGGVAVHTTEFNLSSDDETVASGGTVLFRRRDLKELARRMAAAGHRMAPLNLDPGFGVVDRYIDVPPYRDEPHLRLALSGYAATSVGVIIQKRSD
jgi:2-polyprenyl-3-methyl-5-hydroxy-6-metoxy-1,4-benzoquinol methylase